MHYQVRLLTTSLLLGLLWLAGTATAVCRRPVGIRYYVNERCHAVNCTPAGTCNYTPCTTITVYHDNGERTSTLFGSAISLGYRTDPQAQVGEFAF